MLLDSDHVRRKLRQHSLRQLMQRIRLTVMNPQSSSEGSILAANALLSSGKPRAAIEQYTDVLYSQAPGHIIAFLNRSLAHIADHQPELAAADAYRAALSLDQLVGPSDSKARLRALEIRRYLRAEEYDVSNKKAWVGIKRRTLLAEPQSWTNLPLASILMDETVCPLRADDSNDVLYMRLQARAVFRLAAALLSCGAGPTQDALALLSDALHHKAKLTAQERVLLEHLATSGLQGLTNQMTNLERFGQKTDDDYVLSLPLGPGSDDRLPCITPEAMLKCKSACLPANVYWGDKHEPDFDLLRTRQEIVRFGHQASKTCVPVPNDRSKHGLTTAVAMHAREDHLPGDVLIYERKCWRVTTGSPYHILQKQQCTNSRPVKLYCDSCASAMLMPQELVYTLLLDSKQPKAFTNGSSSAVNDRLQDDNPEKRRRERWCRQTGISFCGPRHQAIYCSKECRRQRRPFHRALHDDTFIEHDLRTGRVPTQEPPYEDVSFAHPRHVHHHSKAQTIYDLMFLRIYASAFHDKKHPLEYLKWVRTNMGPSEPLDARKYPQYHSPWSFVNNIVRPIWMIHRHHAALGQDPLDYLELSDGWVINTLMTKIRLSTQISRGAMSAIIYDMEKERRSYCFRGLEPWVDKSDEAVYQSEEDLDDVWVGLLDPAITMIRCAEESNGEKPNCWLKYDQGVRVIAGQPDDPPDRQGPAIKRGDMLLRPKKEFLGGNPYNVKHFTQREATPSKKATECENGEGGSQTSMMDAPNGGPNLPLRTRRRLSEIREDDDGRTSSSEIEEMPEDTFGYVSSEGLTSTGSSANSSPISPKAPTLRFADSSTGPTATAEHPSNGHHVLNGNRNLPFRTVNRYDAMDEAQEGDQASDGKIVESNGGRSLDARK
ncbi:MAG: hypothetical protein Q9212_006102 [Teloschistes hypoglaucus]